MTDEERSLLSYIIFTILIKKVSSLQLSYQKLQERMGHYWKLYNDELDEPVEFIDYINWLAQSLSDKGYVRITIRRNSIWFSLTEMGEDIDYYGKPTPEYVTNWKQQHKSGENYVQQ